ncbi:MAG: R3H domain-containing nucleic acid-binding protein [Patescibacteria group bacterium]|mgnify:CR=1 FL=1
MEQRKEQETSIIQEAIQELVEKMGFACEIEIGAEPQIETETQVFNIKTDESNFLIGQYGSNLQSLQHIARILVRQKLTGKTKFILDVNFYQQEKNASLGKFAQSMAEQALREKRAIALRPMSPYERRVVHMELSTNPRIKTESIGEGIERKVVISPLNSF